MNANTRLTATARCLARIAAAGAVATAVLFGSQGVAQAAEPAVIHTDTASFVQPATPPSATYDISGTWRIRQGDSTFITVSIDQHGTRFSGTANYSGGSGPLTGLIEGNTVKFEVTWNVASVGFYQAVMHPYRNGYVLDNGITYDELGEGPGAHAGWISLAHTFHQTPAP